MNGRVWVENVSNRMKSEACDVIALLLKAKTNILNVRGLFGVYFSG